jgi:hypothetical protein
MNHTLFINPSFQGFLQNVDDPIMANNQDANSGVSRYNVLWRRIQEVELDNAETYVITPPKLTPATDKCFMLVRVIGSARVNTVGTSFDGVTAVAGKIPVYGVSRFPGIGVFSTYNLSGLTLESLADGTVIEVFTAVTCDDNDARLDTYA